MRQVQGVYSILSRAWKAPQISIWAGSQPTPRRSPLICLDLSGSIPPFPKPLTSRQLVRVIDGHIFRWYLDCQDPPLLARCSWWQHCPDQLIYLSHCRHLRHLENYSNYVASLSPLHFIPPSCTSVPLPHPFSCIWTFLIYLKLSAMHLIVSCHNVVRSLLEI